MAANDWEEGVGFSFVFNLARLRGVTEYEVGPGMRLRRATDAQIQLVKKWLPQISGPAINLGQPWEYVSPTTSDGAKYPPDEMRYFAINFEGPSYYADYLQNAFDISPLDLEIGLTIYESGRSAGGIICAPHRFVPTVENYMFDDVFLEATQDDLALVRETFNLLQAHKTDAVDVHRAVEQIGDLKRLPPKSALVFLGLYAILESLLTHEPKQSDPYSSITRQVKTKLALLDKRFDRAIDYAAFKGATADTVWTKMYEYRSRIAHGAAAEIAGSLKVLQSPAAAKKLLSAATKAVIRHALREPELLDDLRNC